VLEPHHGWSDCLVRVLQNRNDDHDPRHCHLTLLFVTTVFALVMAFVWMFCEFERRFGKRLTAIALVRFGYRPDGTIDRNANRRD
jgi:hypothetical protein